MLNTSLKQDGSHEPECIHVLGLPHSTLYAPRSTLHTLHYTLHYTSHSTLHTPHSALHHTLHFTHSSLHTFHSALSTPHSTLYTVHSTLYTLHSTLYTLHSTLHTENLHRSCVLTGGLCFMDWAPPNRHQTLHFGPKRNHAILMDSWLTGGTKKINHKAMQV